MARSSSALSVCWASGRCPTGSTVSRNARRPRRPGNTPRALRTPPKPSSTSPSASSARAYSRWPSADLNSGFFWMRSSSVWRAPAASPGRELRVRVSQQQLGILGENSCQTSLIDRQRFGGAPQPHELIGIPLSRRRRCRVTFISFSNLRRSPSGSSVVRMPRMARWLVRERSSPGRISAPKYTSEPTNGKRDQHHQHVHPDRVPAGLDAMNDEPQREQARDDVDDPGHDASQRLAKSRDRNTARPRAGK